MKDLVFIVADNNMLNVVGGLLPRYQSLSIRQISFSVFSHSEHDPGCLLSSHKFLIPFTNNFSHAIVMFDRVGCGKEGLNRDQLENIVENNLSINGWSDRAVSLVLDPELEIWIWKDSPHVSRALGWVNMTPNLNTWLFEQGFRSEDEFCPTRPKEAMEAALRRSRLPRSSSIYRQIAETVGIANCTNPTFLKLKVTLQQWFPPNSVDL